MHILKDEARNFPRIKRNTCDRIIILFSKKSLKHVVYVQSNQKMHDLYATKHISQMDLPDAFWAV